MIVAVHLNLHLLRSTREFFSILTMYSSYLMTAFQLEAKKTEADAQARDTP